MLRRAVLFFLLAVSGCRCRPGPVEPIELGFRVQPRELDFGRVLEGAQKNGELTLTAETRAPVTVNLSTDSPFSVQPLAELPGGGEVKFNVFFNAGNTEVNGVLRLTVGDRTAEVKLHGIGVRPPQCIPSAECIVSTYSLEEDRCIETQAPDDSPCDPSSVCLEQGRCRAGECLGIARRCDDNDKCTDDACAMDVGCVHTPHVCPVPTARCTVATCDPNTGCGQGPAPDLTPCGPMDCVSVNFCVSGACRTEPTPEGLPCSPAVACLPEAECHNQVCTRDSAADWAPDWSARIEGTPTGGLAALGSNLFFSMCVAPEALDGGEDAGVDDDGGVDGGEEDAGRPLVCGLASYTGTGFERFLRAYEDDAPRVVRAASVAGVLVSGDGGLELRSQVTGAVRHALDVQVGEAQWALSADGVYLAHDGGLLAWRDGGVDWLTGVPSDSTVVRGGALFAWSADAGVLTRVEVLDDGGVERRDVLVGGVAGPTLLTADGLALFGSAGRVRFESDGGAEALSFDFGDAGVDRFLDEQSLAGGSTTNIFFQRCDGGCETWVRNVEVQGGSPLWEGRLLRAGQDARIVTSTLIDPRPGTFATLIREETDAGPRAYLRLIVDGESKALCRLPETSGAVEQATFSSSALVITAARADGGVVLESYGLGAAPVSRSGWSTPTGVGGSRSDRQ